MGKIIKHIAYKLKMESFLRCLQVKYELMSVCSELNLMLHYLYTATQLIRSFYPIIFIKKILTFSYK
jgi:hypothetical protein